MLFEWNIFGKVQKELNVLLLNKTYLRNYPIARFWSTWKLQRTHKNMFQSLSDMEIDRKFLSFIIEKPIFSHRHTHIETLKWWLHDPGWPEWNSVPFCRDPGSVINSSEIIYILRLRVKSFIPTRWNLSFALPGCCFSRTKFFLMIASAHLSGMKKLTH